MILEAIDVVKTNHIKEMVRKGIREDGRNSTTYRKIKLVKGLLGNAEGSAQVDLGGTKVLAGVKLDLAEPMEDTPDRGNFMVSSELLPLASETYETGPPSPESIELARVVDRGIRAGNCIDLTSLFLNEEKVWSVFVDIYVLNFDGNLFDACTLAAMSALVNTKVPKFEDDKAVREERVKPLKIDNIVTSTTFAKIGDKIILDPSGDEERACDGRLTITTDSEKVRAMQKGLRGGFFQKEIEELMGISFNKNAELKSIIEG